MLSLKLKTMQKKNFKTRGGLTISAEKCAEISALNADVSPVEEY